MEAQIPGDAGWTTIKFSSQKIIRRAKVKTPGFEVQSPCGRAWFVSRAAVIIDYAAFLAEQDNLSTEDALAKAQAECDVEQWFAEQFNWGDVKHHGMLIKHASPEDIERALNAYQERAGTSVADVLDDAGRDDTDAPKPCADTVSSGGVVGDPDPITTIIDLINSLSTEHGNKRVLAFSAELKTKITGVLAAGGLSGETARDTALRFKREADALWRRLHVAEPDAARYRVWRNHMLTMDPKFLDAITAALPAAVGESRAPTADEWDAAIDIAGALPVSHQRSELRAEHAVTRESALAAIAHLKTSDDPARADEAIAMLCAALAFPLIPVAERPPHKATMVIATDGSNYALAYQRYDLGETVWYDANDPSTDDVRLDFVPTHWAEVPQLASGAA
jgi:hypothetical protein